MKATFNKSQIMRNAWSNFKRSNGSKTFAECLKSAWRFEKLQVAMTGFTERVDREFAKENSVSTLGKETASNYNWSAAYEAEKAYRGRGIYWGD